MNYFSFLLSLLVCATCILSAPAKVLSVNAGAEEAEREKDFSESTILERLVSMPDTAKIDYINDNYYAIFSADFETGKNLAAMALELSRNLGDEIRQGYSAMHYGLIMAYTSNIEMALEHYLESFRLFEKHQDIEGLKKLSFEMALTYRRTGNLERAMELLDFVETASRETNDDMNLTRVLGYRGTLHASRGEYAEARPYYEEVYRLRVALADSVGLGYALLDIASLALSEQNFPEAYEYVNRSLEVRRAIGDRQGEAISVLAYGETLNAEGRYNEVFPYYEEAMEMADELGFHDLMRYIYERFIDTYVKLEDFESALEYKNRSVALKDSMFNIDRSRAIEELNTRFETERRDLQIAELQREQELSNLLLQRNRFLLTGMFGAFFLMLAVVLLWQSKVRQRELEYRVTKLETERRIQMERQRISRDLHDHVGAQLVNIISGLSLAERFVQNRPGEKETELINALRQEAQNTIKQLRDTIWTLSKNDISPDAFQEHLDQYLQQYRAMTGIMVEVTHLQESAGMLSPGQALNMFRIIQEALQNAAKHSGASTIWISFDADGDEIVVSIRDNGRFKQPEESVDGLGSGLANMEKRAEEIGGLLRVTGTESGTEVRFVVPLNHASTKQPATARA
jgi:signal transduction histidine kinase